jgi:uncharacterized membrane protein
VLLLDTLQIPFFYHLYDSISNSRILRKLHDKAEKKEVHLRKSRIFQWVQLLGTPGVLTITMLPLKGCGMWSGVLLSKLLRLPKVISYALLIAGSFFGCLLILGAGEVILQFVNSLYK